MRQSVDLVADLQRRNPHFQPSPFYVYLPLPGTEMLDDAVAQGHRPPPDLEGWSRLTFDLDSACSGITSTGGLSPHQARALYLISLVADQRKGFDMPSLVRTMMALYRPIARWRMRGLRLGLFVEMIPYRMVHALWLGIVGLRRRLGRLALEPGVPSRRPRVPAFLASRG